VRPVVPSTTSTDESLVRALAAAKELLREVATALEKNPDLDPDTVRHTLALLRLDPLARLNRSLLRGRAAAAYRA
jgi:hypothetical protein